MNKLLLLAFAHIRKAKAQTMVLVSLLFIASMLSNISLMILFDFTDSFERMAEELQTSDLFFTIPERMYTDEVEQYFLNHEEIEYFQVNNGLVAHITQPAEAVGISIIANKDEVRMISDWRLVSDQMLDLEQAIYVPYHFKVSNGYQLGDEFILEIENQLYEFNIAGFSESLFQNGPVIGDVFFIPDARFDELSTVLADLRFMLIFANGGAENHAPIEMDLLQLTGASGTALQVTDIRSTVMSGNLASMQTFRTMMPSMLAAMLMVFTGIIIVVCLLVIHFRIKNRIDEEMPQFGLLQSVGYTSKQLATAITTQYGIIAIISCLISIVPAYLIIPVISSLFAQQNSFFWNPPVNPIINMIVFLVSCTITLATAFGAAIKIRKITPIQALRSGIQTHNFKKNHFPLEHSKLPLQLLLSCKSALQNKRQSISMFIIIASVSFVATASAIMYYNAIVDTTIFQTVPGVERMDVRIAFIPDEEETILALKEEVHGHSDVYHAQYLDIDRITVDDLIVGVVIKENYETRVINNVYEGIFPRHENEIVISGFIANLLDKDIGDTVLVGEAALPFLITGLSQGMEAGDLLTTYLTINGMRRIRPDFIQSSLAIYLNEDVNIPEFIRQMEIQFEGRYFFVEDSHMIFAEGMAPFITIMSLVSAAIIVISSAVIILVLYFVIGAAITRKRRELGIQKATGYTTWAQMQQVTFIFIVPFILGVIVGCAAGSVAFNIIMSIGMQAAGVMQINYLINPAWVMGAGIGILALSYVSCLLMTWRVRKISVYSLVSE